MSNDKNNEHKNAGEDIKKSGMKENFIRTTSTLKQVAEGLNLSDENEVMKLIKENEEIIERLK